MPVGAEVALPPVAAKDLTMTRSLDSEEKFQRAPALLHVKTKETLPVTLLSVSREKVEFTWDAAESKSLEIAQLHAHPHGLVDQSDATGLASGTTRC